jgi:hypothetical protein
MCGYGSCHSGGKYSKPKLQRILDCPSKHPTIALSQNTCVKFLMNMPTDDDLKLDSLSGQAVALLWELGYFAYCHQPSYYVLWLSKQKTIRKQN